MDRGRDLAAIRRLCRRMRARLRVRDESGFTLIELLAAVFVTTIGVIALITTLDTSRELITFSEKRETAVHVAQRELERVQALPYENVALITRPARSYDESDPAWYVTGDFYRWNQARLPSESGNGRVARCGSTGLPGEACERMVVDAGNGQVSSDVSTVEETGGNGNVRISLRVQRFVTWVDDPCPNCASSEDYKRVSVAVRIMGQPELSGVQGGVVKPIVLTTLVSEDKSL